MDEGLTGYIVIYDKGDNFSILCSDDNTGSLYLEEFEKAIHDVDRIVLDARDNVSEIINFLLYNDFRSYTSNEEIRKLYTDGKLETLKVSIDFNKKELFIL